VTERKKTVKFGAALSAVVWNVDMLIIWSHSEVLNVFPVHTPSRSPIMSV